MCEIGAILAGFWAVNVNMRSNVPATSTALPSPTGPQRLSAAAEFGQQIEAWLLKWLSELNATLPPRPARGAPPVVPAVAIWASVLVCILKGCYTQLAVWRQLVEVGLWSFPRFQVTDMAVYKRLERMAPAQMEDFFKLVSTAIRTGFPEPSDTQSDLPSFPTGIFALDGTVLDAMLRKLKMLRTVSRGDPALLAGKLGALFDLRRQQWERVRYFENPMESDHNYGWSMVEGLPAGAMIVADLGYFGFLWFDRLTDSGYHFVSRIEERISYEVLHTYYEGHSHGVSVRDRVVYLGKHAANRAAHPVRLIEVTIRTESSTRVHRYITNVLDAKLLSVRQVVELYRRRWDIEQVFNLLKTHLKMSVLPSGHANAILVQVFATFTIAQIILAMRAEIARQAHADVREVSLKLLVQYTPQLLADKRDVIAFFVERGRHGGFIRPFRGVEYTIPRIQMEDYEPLMNIPPPRQPRYRRPDGSVLPTSRTLKEAKPSKVKLA